MAEGENVSSVSINNVEASKEVVDLLIQNNHKQIAMINGRREAAVSVERYKGYIKSLGKNNIEIKDEYIVYADFLEESAYEKTKELLNKYPEITALFCASDMMAFGAMKAIKEMGKKIPEDISIVGFDDTPLSAYSSPALTTVSQDFYLMGKEAAKQLFKMIKKQEGERNICLEHKVLVRNSVSVL